MNKINFRVNAIFMLSINSLKNWFGFNFFFLNTVYIEKYAPIVYKVQKDISD